MLLIALPSVTQANPQPTHSQPTANPQPEQAVLRSSYSNASLQNPIHMILFLMTHQLQLIAAPKPHM